MAQITDTSPGPGVGDDLKERLNERHGEYDAVARNVQVYLDVTEGDRDALIGPPINADNFQGTTDITRASGAKASPVIESKYLQRGVAEGDQDYKKRLNETEPFLVSPKIISYVVASIYNPLPQYSGVDTIRDLMRSVNSHELSYTQAMVEICDLALVCGYAFMLVDSTRTPEMGDLTIAQARSQGVRPTLAAYSPLGIYDWEHDEKGLAWIHLYETVKSRPNPWAKRSISGMHIIADRATVWRFQETTNAGGIKAVVLVSAIPHGMDEVPGEFLTFVQAKRKKRGIGKSFIGASARADLAALRAESYRAISLQVHGTPHLWRRLSETEWEMMTNLRATQEAGTNNPKPIDYAFVANQMQLGYSGYHICIGKDSDIGYATLDTGGIEQFRLARNDAHRSALENAGFDPATIQSGADGSKAATVQSGVSKAYGFEMNQGVQVKFLSSRMAEFDSQVLRKYMMKAGGNADGVAVNYPKPAISMSFAQISDELDLLASHRFSQEVQLAGYLAALPYMQLFDGKDPDAMAQLTKTMENLPKQNELSRTVVERPEDLKKEYAAQSQQ